MSDRTRTRNRLDAIRSSGEPPVWYLAFPALNVSCGSCGLGPAAVTYSLHDDHVADLRAAVRHHVAEGARQPLSSHGHAHSSGHGRDHSHGLVDPSIRNTGQRPS